MNKKIIITGVLSAALLIGGVAMAHTHDKPTPAQTTTAPLVTTKAPVAQVEVSEPVVDNTVRNLGITIDDETEPINPNGAQYYTPWSKRPAGIVIYQIAFHEGHRAAGLKAVDVHIMARSNANENEMIQGRDEIVSITGSTGKVYSMIGTKRTGVNTNAAEKNFQEQEITEYQDISVNEKSITSIVVRHDGKLITVKPDKDTKIITTHA